MDSSAFAEFVSIFNSDGSVHEHPESLVSQEYVEGDEDPLNRLKLLFDIQYDHVRV